MCILFILDKPKCNDIQQPLFSSHGGYCPASINKRQCSFSQWQSLVHRVRINIHNFQHHRWDIHNISDSVLSLCTNVILWLRTVIYGGSLKLPLAVGADYVGAIAPTVSVGLALTDSCCWIVSNCTKHACNCLEFRLWLGLSPRAHWGVHDAPSQLETGNPL